MRTASISMITGSTATPSISRAVVILAKGVIAALDRWQARRQALRQLYLLDRRTLKDIGMNRSEVQSIIYGNVVGRGIDHAGR